MFFISNIKKKIIMELHHDLKIESRIVNFLAKKLKFLNSKHIQKIIAITQGVKEEYVDKKIISKTKIVVLPSGSSIKKKFDFSYKKNFLILVILDPYTNQEV